MPIKRFYAIKDNSITNAVRISEQTDATNANMGKSDSLEAFYFKANIEQNIDSEESRIIIKFDANEMYAAHQNLDFPADAKFYLRMFDVKHDKAVPSSFSLKVTALDKDFNEGYGLDMETYRDIGASNWTNATDTEAWTTPGGNTLAPLSEFYFEKGTEDLIIDITEHVNAAFIQDPDTLDRTPLGGLLIHFDSSTSADYYTKKFYSRTTSSFYKKPCIEVRWESVIQDDGGSLYKYTDRLSAEDNEQTLYLYNWVDGELKQIPEPVAYFKTWPNEDFTGTPTTIAATNVSTGVYKVDYTPESGVDKIYYTWERTGDERYLSGSIDLIDREYGNDFATPDYNITINNLKDSYSTTEKANMRLSIKKRDRDLNIYTVAQSDFQNDIIKRIYYKVTRRADNFDAIPYGIGENNMPEFTKLSYDSTGNYFDLDMSLFEPGFMYEISFLYKVKSNYVEYRNKFKFRVE